MAKVHKKLHKTFFEHLKNESSNGLIFESHVPMDVFYSCDLKKLKKNQ
jgi:hypothetical protein